MTANRFKVHRGLLWGRLCLGRNDLDNLLIEYIYQYLFQPS